ncbi:MAG: hypothetical protein IKE60_20170 [Reyranella sp.]|uniref:hypothetical protein n=1 Tax=Reyranella sp. TaxID=1929291 RepID=UPI0025CE4589|nr:hypothetical protein [Reyranella sp.]MBR2816983.1 hypothetical protein [Reyranella sp.]
MSDEDFSSMGGHDVALAEQIRGSIESGEYERALDLAKAASLENRLGPEALRALFEMTAKLRSKCMDLASWKQDTGPVYQALEATLIKANELTGEDMYGRRHSS